MSAASAPLAVLVDGDPVPAGGAGWTLDRALQFGDGLFETILVEGGMLRFEALHRARLARGCRRLQMNVDPELPWQYARQLALLHPGCTLKLLVSRGTALARGYGPTGEEQPRIIAMAFDAPKESEFPSRLRVATLQAVMGVNPQLGGLKHCNRLEQVLGRLELRGGKAYEGLMASSSGRLVSGTMSNVFLALDNEWMTPAIGQCGVAGVMRSVVLREADDNGLQIREGEVEMAALRKCTAMFLTNARMGVREVHELDGRQLPPDPRVARLAARVREIAD